MIFGGVGMHLMKLLILQFFPSRVSICHCEEYQVPVITGDGSYL